MTAAKAAPPPLKMLIDDVTDATGVDGDVAGSVVREFGGTVGGTVDSTRTCEGTVDGTVGATDTVIDAPKTEERMRDDFWYVRVWLVSTNSWYVGCGERDCPVAKVVWVWSTVRV